MTRMHQDVGADFRSEQPEPGHRMACTLGESDGAIVVREMRRQGIPAFADSQTVFPIRGVVARTGSLADMARQARDRRAVDDHLVGSVGSERPAAVLQAEPLDLQFPYHGSPLL